MKDYITARAEAGTPIGDEYAQRLEAMLPADAADEIADMFQLCADEDLAIDISSDLQLSRDKAEPIAAELRKLRRRAMGAVMAILIAPDSRTVVDIGIDPNDHAEHIQCIIAFECAHLRCFPMPNGLDEGVIYDEGDSEGPFKPPTYFRLGKDGPPLAGRCLIIGRDADTGATRDASMTGGDVTAMVIWGQG